MPGSGIVSELEVISSKSISNICWIWSFGQLFGLAVPMSSTKISNIIWIYIYWEKVIQALIKYVYIATKKTKIV